MVKRTVGAGAYWCGRKVWGWGADALVLAAALTLAACGGGDTSSGRTYNTVGGAVQLNMVNNPGTGLPAGLVLNDGNESYTVPAGAATFAFPTGLGAGDTYNVTVVSSPTGLNCVVTAPSGTMARAAVSSVQVNCSDVSVQLGGSVSGMQLGGGVQLTDGTDTIVVTASTLQGVGGSNPVSYTSSCTPRSSANCITSATWKFPTRLPYRTPYDVQIQGQSLVQCGLGNGVGAVGPADITDITLNCTMPQLGILAGSSSVSGSTNTGAGATSASFYGPFGVAVDASGNKYVADTRNNLIRKITPSGIVTTLAGSPSRASGYADGTGAAAIFNFPTGLAVDSQGYVYVADLFNHMIRKISPAGEVTTLAGSTTSGSSDGQGASAGFWFPAGVAVDASGNVYVADSGNNLIRKITPGGMVSTLAGLTSLASGHADGTGASASFYMPYGITVDSVGNLYVADSQNSLIRKITPAGVVTTLAGSGALGFADGTGAAAIFATPYGITVDASGTLYVADMGNHVIRTITPAGVVTTLAGSGTGAFSNGVGLSAAFFAPYGITVDSFGTLYVADTGNNQIRMITPARLVSTLAGSGGSGYLDGTGTGASFNMLAGLAVDYSGNTYVTEGNRIRKITPAGVVTTLAGSARWGFADGTGGAATFNNPGGIAVDANGTLYVADTGNHSIRRVTSAGVVTTLAGSATQSSGSVDGTGTQASFYSPRGIAVDSTGNNIYVADTSNNLIRKITSAGVVTTLAGSRTLLGLNNGLAIFSSFSLPRGIAVDVNGNVFVADAGNCVIRKIVQASPMAVVSTFSGVPYSCGFSDGVSSSAKFSSPSNLVVDVQGNVYVSDTLNQLIRKLSPTGEAKTFAGTMRSPVPLAPSNLPGSFQSPTGIGLSQPDASGHFNLYFATGSAVAGIVNVDVY